MSNALAIAATTATLRNLIDRGIRSEVGSGTVTARPPDKARDNGESSNQINLFLYHTLPNAALLNQDLPNRVKPGETGRSPLALKLYYLLTAYGQDNDDIAGHRLLGTAMRVLHDNPVLNPADIQLALAESDLQNQVERVRITPQPLSVDELSKLWTTFQTQYRISATYEVSVVLIESNRPVRTPLPVLTRGVGDRGVVVQPSLVPPFPTLESVQPPNQQPSARLGEPLTLRGYHLKSDDGQAIARFTHPRLSRPIERVVSTGESPAELVLEIPNESPSQWLAGLYAIAVQLQQDGRTQTTNTLSFSLAPQIQNIQLSPTRRITITCTPAVQTDQRIALLLGSQELLPLLPEGIAVQQVNMLTFNASSLPAGEYFVRLRVDGVDSLLIDWAAKPPVFDQRQKVVLP
jgi:hypothetical protein